MASLILANCWNHHVRVRISLSLVSPHRHRGSHNQERQPLRSTTMVLPLLSLSLRQGEGVVKDTGGQKKKEVASGSAVTHECAFATKRAVAV